DSIKIELGPEAIILQTKKNKKGFGLLSRGSFEVTAAVSDRSLMSKKSLEARLPVQTKETLQKMKAEKQAEIYNKYTNKNLDKLASQTKDIVQLGKIKNNPPEFKPEFKSKATMRYIDIKDELDVKPQFTQSIETGAQSLLAKPVLATPALLEGFENLVINGVEKNLALKIMRHVQFELGDEKSKQRELVLDEVASEMMKSPEIIDTVSLWSLEKIENPPEIIALIGTTGVGKTTTIAKLASKLTNIKKWKIGLINYDTQKATAFDQCSTYAKILNLPFRSAMSTEDLKAAVSDFRSMDIVFIDTSGYSQKEEESLRQLQTELGSIDNLKHLLVFSGTTRDLELIDTAKKFSIFNPFGVIFTKLDEATTFGYLLNIYNKTRLPYVYFGVGQRIPDDLEYATKERIVSLVMDL
ncbi:MAG: hypothetical protein HY843_04570, partial [Bdellovibrio sp.]|nr:hypothetical protein [Bdellovibrio sp.]